MAAQAPSLDYDPNDPSTWGAGLDSSGDSTIDPNADPATGLPYGYGSGEDTTGTDPTDFQQFDPYGPGAASTKVTYGGGYLTTTKTLTDDFGNRWDLGHDGMYHNTDGKATYSMPAIGGQNTRQYLPQPPQGGAYGAGGDGMGMGAPGQRSGQNGPQFPDNQMDTYTGDNGQLMRATAGQGQPYQGPGDYGPNGQFNPGAAQQFYGQQSGDQNPDAIDPSQYGLGNQQGFDPSQAPAGYGLDANPDYGGNTGGFVANPNAQQGNDFLFDPYTGRPLSQAAGTADIQGGPAGAAVGHQTPASPYLGGTDRGGGGSGATLTPDEIRSVAERAGFTGAGLDRVVQIAMAESGGQIDNRSGPNRDQWGSIDRGLMRLNSHWNGDVSDADANDPYAAMVAAYRISKGGTDFSDWTTNKNGAADRQPSGGGGVRPEIQQAIDSYAPAVGRGAADLTTGTPAQRGQNAPGSDLPQGEEAPRYNLSTGEPITGPDAPEGISSKAYENGPGVGSLWGNVSGHAAPGTSGGRSAFGTAAGLGLLAYGAKRLIQQGRRNPEGAAAAYATNPKNEAAAFARAMPAQYAASQWNRPMATGIYRQALQRLPGVSVAQGRPYFGSNAIRSQPLAKPAQMYRPPQRQGPPQLFPGVTPGVGRSQQGQLTYGWNPISTTPRPTPAPLYQAGSGAAGWTPPVQGSPNFYMAPGSSYGGPTTPAPQWTSYGPPQPAPVQGTPDFYMAPGSSYGGPTSPAPALAPPQRRFEPAPSDRTYGGTSSTRVQ